jgi:hypothetical protein
MLKEITKKHETRKTIDGTAGSGRRQSITRERKSMQNKEGEGESGPQTPAFDEARLEGYYMRVG